MQWLRVLAGESSSRIRSLIHCGLAATVDARLRLEFAAGGERVDF